MGGGVLAETNVAAATAVAGFPAIISDPPTPRGSPVLSSGAIALAESTISISTAMEISVETL